MNEADSCWTIPILRHSAVFCIIFVRRRKVDKSSAKNFPKKDASGLAFRPKIDYFSGVNMVESHK